MRPKFCSFADTPSTAIDLGSSIAPRSDRPGSGRRVAVARRAAAVEGHQVLAPEGEGVHLELGDIGARRPRSTQKRHAIAMNARKQRSSSPSETIRRWPRTWPEIISYAAVLLEQLEELLGGGLGRDRLGDAHAGPQHPSEVLGIDAPKPRGDDRAELTRCADADEELFAEPLPPAFDKLDNENALDARACACGAGR
jgi:hypothetical protein